jgi:hypothetical protein
VLVYYFVLFIFFLAVDVSISFGATAGASTGAVV